ncbi:hypothetical protein BT63DRAFT_425258 [Microthyrium microscopicum]|uniref:Cora-domain-containing protein n=1 Tax=Microthyrium microscopicum TaxID=703497 RepID=A0A6A6UDM3_9PEZI|nr:hypothetical protein BT63DRAFT_425258 [Microthyrium microscopicum]
MDYTSRDRSHGYDSRNPADSRRADLERQLKVRAEREKLALEEEILHRQALVSKEERATQREQRQSSSRVIERRGTETHVVIESGHRPTPYQRYDNYSYARAARRGRSHSGAIAGYGYGRSQSRSRSRSRSRNRSRSRARRRSRSDSRSGSPVSVGYADYNPQSNLYPPPPPPARYERHQHGDSRIKTRIMDSGTYERNRYELEKERERSRRMAPYVEVDLDLDGGFGSDSDYSITLIDEDEASDDVPSGSLGANLSLDKPDNKTEQKPPVFNFDEYRVLPTKYGLVKDSSSKDSLSILIEEELPANVAQNPPTTGSQNLNSNSKRNGALFKWLHLKQDHLNFRTFKEFVLEKAEITSAQTKDLLLLLSSIEDSITPIETQDGKGRQMEPLSKINISKSDRPASELDSLIWLCFPYFSFEAYSAVKLPDGSSDHPAQTLLQLYDSATSKSRDLKQVVTTMDSKNSGKCIHVSQLWCLVINHDLLITCSRLDIKSLRGDIVKAVSASLPLPEPEKSKFKDESPYVQVYDGGNSIFLLSAEKCQTWFEFVSQLREFGTESDFQIFDGSTLVTAINWVELAIPQRSKQATVRLVIRPIRSSPRPFQAPPRPPPWEPSSESILSDDEDIDSDDDPAERSPAELPEGYGVPETAPRISSTANRREGRQNEARDIAASFAVDDKDDAVSTELKPSDITEEIEILGAAQETKPMEQKKKNRKISPTKSPTFVRIPPDEHLENNQIDDFKQFRVFTWLCAVEIQNDQGINVQAGGSRGVDSLHVDQSKLSGLMDRLHIYLVSNKRKSEKMAYADCKEMNYAEFRQDFEQMIQRAKREGKEYTKEYLRAQRAGPTTSAHSRSQRSRRRSRSPSPLPPHPAYQQAQLREKIKNAQAFAQTAKECFRCFLPLYHDSPVASKYWGGVNRITSQILFQKDDNIQSIMNINFRIVQDLIKEISSKLSAGLGPPPSRLKIPAHFPEAFMKIIVFATGYQPTENSTHRFASKLREARSKLERGLKQIIETSGSGSISDLEAVPPIGVLGSIVLRMLQDVTHGQMDLIPKCYRSYIIRLEEEVRLDPKNREHQTKVINLQQELGMIIDVLIAEKVQLETLTRGLGREGTARTSFTLLDTEGRSAASPSRAWAQVKGKIAYFQHLSRTVRDIERTHQRLIETNKDTQETASLIFAIVSVIFLPLTTVASILGMNTSEIRNMNQTQWVFWVTGIPLVIIAGIFCLWATTKLSEFRAWAGRKMAHWLVRGLAKRSDDRAARARADRRRSRAKYESTTSSNNYYTGSDDLPSRRRTYGREMV